MLDPCMTVQTRKCKYGALVTSTNFISIKDMVFINTGWAHYQILNHLFAACVKNL